jgi:hypothetical protein
MKAEELRIGNYVYENGTARKIYSLDVGGETAYRINDIPIVKKTGLTLDGEQVFKPIPITEEWLLMIGFKLTSFSKTTHKYYLLDIDNDPDTYSPFFYSKDGTDVELLTAAEEANITTCKYLHELQNLYYALTGYELKLKQ